MGEWRWIRYVPSISAWMCALLALGCIWRGMYANAILFAIGGAFACAAAAETDDRQDPTP